MGLCESRPLLILIPPEIFEKKQYWLGYIADAECEQTENRVNNRYGEGVSTGTSCYACAGANQGPN